MPGDVTKIIIEVPNKQFQKNLIDAIEKCNHGDSRKLSSLMRGTRMKLELFTNRAGKAQLRLRGRNGRKLMTAQRYTRPANAKATARAIVAAGRLGFVIVDRRTRAFPNPKPMLKAGLMAIELLPASGKLGPRLRLRARNWEIIMAGEHYTRASSAMDTANAIYFAGLEGRISIVERRS